ncbi:MAG: type II toxin-antitoxin system Phd/YefM family antitoxin [Candidatus Omnitrophota bacterium]
MTVYRAFSFSGDWRLFYADTAKIFSNRPAAEDVPGIFDIGTQYGTLRLEVMTMVKSISVRKLRANLSSILEDVKLHLDRYVISKRGKPEAVLMCVDDYEGWIETLEIISNRKTLADIKEAKQELTQGKHFTFKEVFGRPQKKRGKKK